MLNYISSLIIIFAFLGYSDGLFIKKYQGKWQYFTETISYIPTKTFNLYYLLIKR